MVFHAISYLGVVLRFTGCANRLSAFTMSSYPNRALRRGSAEHVLETDCFSVVRILCCAFDRETGGADRDRTDDLKLAKLRALPTELWPRLIGNARQMVGPERVERSTSRLSGVRSNHLSYEPDEVAAKGSVRQDVDARRSIGGDGKEGKRRRRQDSPIV